MSERRGSGSRRVQDEQAAARTAATLRTSRSHAQGDAFVFGERYEDRGPIARGGWGEVRRVHDRTMQRTVAVKVLSHRRQATSRTHRSLNEARVTASLDHPGIVPILDGGVLADGRAWFAMKEIAGRTLEDVLADDRTEQALRRGVELLMRVAEIVGYAHERGVVHRDLKPSNVMVGRFGEVFVLDWGIARSSDEAPRPRRERREKTTAARTSQGTMLGTIAYMPPEQARGDRDAVGPASDVYALGLVLFEILHGRRARSGSTSTQRAQAIRGALAPIERGPDELRVLCERAVSRAVAERPPNGMAFALELRAWLDGAARVERAAQSVSRSKELVLVAAQLRARRDRLRVQASQVIAGVREFEPVEKKWPAWELEDRAREIERELSIAETRRVELLRGALEHEPTYAPAHEELARVHRASLLDAEARGDDAVAVHHHVLLREHDRGEHTAFLRDTGRVRLDSVPTAAEVVAFRWRSVRRQLVLEEVGSLGHTPIDAELPVGSYVLSLRADGRACRYPIVIRRDETWQARRPGAARARAVRILEAPAGQTYVPGGPVPVGYDALAAEPVPSREVWVDDFVIQTFPVSCIEYLTFLDDLVRRGREREAWAHAPKQSVPSATPSVRREAGRFEMLPDEHARPIDPSEPIASIDWHAATAYARWWSEQTGQAWRLPNELEWEKAARGVDRRPFPWGAQPETTWACVLGCGADAPRRAPIDSYPIDESPYGVRGMAGNVRDWCINVWRPEGPRVVDGVVEIDAADELDTAPRTIRGGGWTSVIAFARSAGRFAAAPNERFSVVGLRLVAAAARRSR